MVGYAAALQITNRLARIALHSAVRVSSFKQFTRVKELTGYWEETLWMIDHTLWQINDTPPDIRISCGPPMTFQGPLNYAAALQLKFVASLVYYACEELPGEGVALVADTMRS